MKEFREFAEPFAGASTLRNAIAPRDVFKTSDKLFVIGARPGLEHLAEIASFRAAPRALNSGPVLIPTHYDLL